MQSVANWGLVANWFRHPTRFSEKIHVYGGRKARNENVSRRYRLVGEHIIFSNRNSVFPTVRLSIAIGLSRSIRQSSVISRQFLFIILLYQMSTIPQTSTYIIADFEAL
jgi:hypothetical protein